MLLQTCSILPYMLLCLFYLYEIWYVRGFTYINYTLRCIPNVKEAQNILFIYLNFLEIRRGNLHFDWYFPQTFEKLLYLCDLWHSNARITGAHIFVSNIWQRNSSCYKPTCFKQTRKNRCFRKLSVIEYLTLQWLQDIFSSGPQSIRLLSDIIVFQMKMWFDLIDLFLFNVYIVL